MEKYVDGFVLAVPRAELREYKKMAKLAAKAWMKHGALDYKECVGEDMSPEWAELTFPQLADLKDDEVVVFAYITFKSRAHRDRVNAKVMKDPIMNDPKYKDTPMPFEMNRMAYGGFEVLVDGKTISSSDLESSLS